MKVIDLKDEYKKAYFICLEEWSDEMKESGNHKECWYNKVKDKGLCVKLVVDDKGDIGGMIQYMPIEHSFAEGVGLYMVKCIWVHGHKQGRGNFQKKGMGRALLKAAEEDVKNKGAKGLVVWGLSIPVWMKASWYKKQGYKKADKDRIKSLLWKPFSEDALPPKWIKRKKRPKKVSGKVIVTAFINGWCPAVNIVFERTKRVCGELGDKVEFKVIDTSYRDVFQEWGITDAIYINNKELRNGPPPSYKKIKRRITRKVRRLG